MTTERQRLAEQLRQARKVEALERLAGGVAHDFNNLLTAILGFAEMARDGIPAEHPARRDLSQIERTAHRAAVLTRQLLAYSRRQILEARTVDLNATVAGLEPMLGRLAGAKIQVAVRYGPDLGSVSVDPGQIEQVLVHLAVNARDAMPLGGRLTIETKNTPESAVEDPAGAPRPHVMIEVGDTGHGIPPDILDQVFEPFFTTKETGTGTGLGLSIVQGIVRQSGGTIDVASEAGGTTFRILLPRVGAVAAKIPATEVAASTPRGTETLLLIEDELVVRRALQVGLERHGYAVLEAANPVDAIAACARLDQPIDLVICDLVMPSMSGGDVAKRLKSLRPGMRVLFISGHVDSEGTLLAAGDAFLQKPFTPDQLARKVRQVLEPPPVASTVA